METLLLTSFKGNQRSLHLQGRWWPYSFGMQNALCLWTLFKRATSSMENTLPIYWGSYERISKPNSQENIGPIFSSEPCSHTQVLDFNGQSAWLQSWAGRSPSRFSWFGPIWLSPFVSPNRKKVFSWEPVMMASYLQLITLFYQQNETCFTNGIWSRQHQRKSMCGLQAVEGWGFRVMLKSKPHLVTFPESILVKCSVSWSTH